MGKLPSGPFGPMQGTTGNLTAYMLNGQNVVRINPNSNAQPRKRDSPAQLSNQQQLKVVNEFLDPILPLLKAGYSIAALNSTKNYYNLALSHNKRFALKGDYPNIEIDYPNAMFSEGELLPAINPVAELVPEGIKFSWDQADGSVNSRNFDQVMVLAYGTISKRVRYIRYGVERQKGLVVLHIIDNLINEPMETYISFINDERTAVANSMYTGLVGG